MSRTNGRAATLEERVRQIRAEQQAPQRPPIMDGVEVRIEVPPPEPEDEAPLVYLQRIRPEEQDGFSQLPHYVWQSGIVGHLNRMRRNLGTHVLNLFRYAGMKDHCIFADDEQLGEDVGIKARTVKSLCDALSDHWTFRANGKAVAMSPLLAVENRVVGTSRQLRKVRVVDPHGLHHFAMLVAWLWCDREKKRQELRAIRMEAGRRGAASTWNSRRRRSGSPAGGKPGWQNIPRGAAFATMAKHAPWGMAKWQKQPRGACMSKKKMNKKLSKRVMSRRNLFSEISFCCRSVQDLAVLGREKKQKPPALRAASSAACAALPSFVLGRSFSFARGTGEHTERREERRPR